MITVSAILWECVFFLYLTLDFKDFESLPSSTEHWTHRQHSIKLFYCKDQSQVDHLGLLVIHKRAEIKKLSPIL